MSDLRFGIATFTTHGCCLRAADADYRDYALSYREWVARTLRAASRQCRVRIGAPADRNFR